MREKEENGSRSKKKKIEKEEMGWMRKRMEDERIKIIEERKCGRGK